MIGYLRDKTQKSSTKALPGIDHRCQGILQSPRETKKQAKPWPPSSSAAAVHSWGRSQGIAMSPPITPLSQDPCCSPAVCNSAGLPELENARQDLHPHPLAAGNSVRVLGTQCPTGWLESPTHSYMYNSKTLLYEITKTW